MDFTILIFITLFAIACFSLFLVYKFGIKEKSYEEALAEQRQQTSTLLGAKSKPKEKKNKKATKKPKEKSNKNEQEEIDNNENKENTRPVKPHVEFREETEEVPIKEELNIPVVKEAAKPKKVKKVKPILINKKEQSPVRPILEVVEVPIANHFEENPPKDDFELLRANSRDDIFKQEPIKEKVTKEKKHALENPNVGSKNKKNAKPQADIPKTELILPPPEEKVVIDVIPVVPQTNGVVVGNTGKEKKKKKSEFNTRQQLTAERDGLINSVRKAELSKTEIQLLIDLLLNKQHEAPAVIDEWSEGKFDPIQKLKKQLAEKENLLSEEQQALAGAQAKLREIRSEQQAEKIQLQQKIRGLEEMVQTKLIEIQAANNRFQVNSQKILQLQAELNSEIMKTHKVMEDNTALQMQIKQYEVSLAQLQETESVIGKQRCDIEELSAQNQQLQQHQQHFMIQMSNLEKGYKDSHQELERNLEIALRQENDWKREISNLNSALQTQFEEHRKLEHTLNQLNDQLRLSNNEKTQLKSELQQTKDELNRLSELSEGKNSHEVQILNLSNELSSTRNELSSTRNELSSRIEELQQTDKKYKTELETWNKKYLLVQKELEDQKIKNNELRTKNWKVMEALNAAESKANKHGTNNTDVDVKKLTADIITKQQDSQKQFIQRLFPEIEDLKTTNSNDWQEKYAQLIRNYVDSFKEEQKKTSVSPLSSPHSMLHNSSDVAKLQSQLLNYKRAIDDSEGILNKLQNQIGEEEIKWRSQLAAKEAELDDLKKSHLSQLQTKLLSVETHLSKEIEEKQRLLEECQLLKSQKTHNGASVDSIATIEKLSEEVNRLREQLIDAQTKNGDIGVCIKTQNCNNSTNGPAFIEHCLSSSSSIASSLIGEYKKPKNKKRKKKAERHHE